MSRVIHRELLDLHSHDRGWRRVLVLAACAANYCYGVASRRGIALPLRRARLAPRVGDGRGPSRGVAAD